MYVRACACALSKTKFSGHIKVCISICNWGVSCHWNPDCIDSHKCGHKEVQRRLEPEGSDLVKSSTPQQSQFDGSIEDGPIEEEVITGGGFLQLHQPLVPSYSPTVRVCICLAWE